MATIDPLLNLGAAAIAVVILTFGYLLKKRRANQHLSIEPDEALSQVPEAPGELPKTEEIIEKKEYREETFDDLVNRVIPTYYKHFGWNVKGKDIPLEMSKRYECTIDSAQAIYDELQRLYPLCCDEIKQALHEFYVLSQKERVVYERPKLEGVFSSSEFELSDDSKNSIITYCHGMVQKAF